MERIDWLHGACKVQTLTWWGPIEDPAPLFWSLLAGSIDAKAALIPREALSVYQYEYIYVLPANTCSLGFEGEAKARG